MPPLAPDPPTQPAATAANVAMKAASNETVVLSAQDLQALSVPSAPSDSDPAPEPGAPPAADVRVVEEIREAIGGGDAELPPMAPGMDAAAMELDEARLQPPLPGGVVDTLEGAETAPDERSPIEVGEQLGQAQPEQPGVAPSELEQQLGGPDASIDLGGEGISLTPEGDEDDFHIEFDFTSPADQQVPVSEGPTAAAPAESSPAIHAEEIAIEAAPEPELTPRARSGAAARVATFPRNRVRARSCAGSRIRRFVVRARASGRARVPG